MGDPTSLYLDQTYFVRFTCKVLIIMNILWNVLQPTNYQVLTLEYKIVINRVENVLLNI